MDQCPENVSGPASRGVLRVAALSDVHCKQTSRGALKQLFRQVAEAADVLLMCGDLTDFGLVEEARVLAAEMETISGKIPILSVFGNHDFQSGMEREISRILTDAGVIMLDGNGCEFNGIGFTGVKGFGGGFGNRALQPWGEDIIKQFVAESSRESVKLDSALAAMESPRRVVLLHYAPIRETVVGEPPEVYPFLGTSRLEEPIDRYPVIAVFHGHAHFGTLEGRTKNGTPVYNVSVSLLRRNFPDRPPFFLVEIPV